jgi:hypothetical protein
MVNASVNLRFPNGTVEELFRTGGGPCMFADVVTHTGTAWVNTTGTCVLSSPPRVPVLTTARARYDVIWVFTYITNGNGGRNAGCPVPPYETQQVFTLGASFDVLDIPVDGGPRPPATLTTQLPSQPTGDDLSLSEASAADRSRVHGGAIAAGGFLALALVLIL